MKDVIRCKITGNPCGTDTHQVDAPCCCENCVEPSRKVGKEWAEFFRNFERKQQNLSPAIQKLVDEHFWDLV